MITLFTGSPGAGKTASLVHYLSTLVGDRLLYVHGENGVPCLNGLTLPHTVIDANNWHKEMADGGILVIDEVQSVWRPRGSGSKVPDSVAALETHRHHGIDVYLTTQAPSLLDSNVRRLVGRHVHIRDTGVLGRYWYEWPETNDQMQWKTCINKKRYSLPKKAFALYKSSSLHVAPVRGVPRVLFYGLAALVAFIALGYLTYAMIKRNTAIAIPPLPQVTTSPVNMTQSGGGGSHGPIDDRVDWTPRTSSRPESALAYDHLRVVVAMPVVTMGMCIGDDCVCRTQQGTNAGLTSSECRAWIANPPFNAYLAPKRDDKEQMKPQDPPKPQQTVAPAPMIEAPKVQAITS